MVISSAESVAKWGDDDCIDVVGESIRVEREIADPFGVGADVVVEGLFDGSQDSAVLAVAFHGLDVASIEDPQRAFVDDGPRDGDVTADDGLHLVPNGGFEDPDCPCEVYTRSRHRSLASWSSVTTILDFRLAHAIHEASHGDRL